MGVFLYLHLSGWFHLPVFACVCVCVCMCVCFSRHIPVYVCPCSCVSMRAHMCTLLAVPSWRSWSHDPNEGRPSAAPVNCLQESERERERRECQAELKMRKGVLGSGSCGRETRGRRWVVVVVQEWGVLGR